LADEDRKLAYLPGHHGEAPARGARVGRLDGGVHAEQGDRLGDIARDD
jgi:hypothetical protein